jgi:hypothetical protein
MDLISTVFHFSGAVMKLSLYASYKIGLLMFGEAAWWPCSLTHMFDLGADYSVHRSKPRL